jgi:hypothetical protein
MYLANPHFEEIKVVLEIKSVVRLLALFRHTAFLQLLQQTGLA